VSINDRLLIDEFWLFTVLVDSDIFDGTTLQTQHTLNATYTLNKTENQITDSMKSYNSLFAGILAIVIAMAFSMTAIAQTSGVDITSKERIFERNSQIAYFKNNGPQLMNECANRIEPANWANRSDIITYVWSEGNGYIFGTNLYGDTASAQYFEPDGSVTLSGAEYTIGAKLGSTGTVVFGVWDFASKDLLTSVEVNFADIEDELDETPTAYYVEFDNPVEVTGPYLLGYDISGLGGFNPDSYFVGLSSSVVGDAGGANTAYNLESSGQWVPQGNYGVDVEIAVFGCSAGNPDPTISLNPLELNFRVTEGSYDSELLTVRNNGLQTLTVDLAPSFNGTVMSFDSSDEYQRYLDRQSSTGSLSPVSEEFMPHLLTDDELTISQTSLSLEPFESAVLVVTANASALTAGSYPASIAITSNDPANGSINYPVGFTVVEPVSVIWEQFATTGNGIVSAFFDTTGTGQGSGAFSSDDFEITANSSITEITTDGFFSGTNLGNLSSLTWQIYPDDNGKPAGNPETNPGAAIWSLTKLTRSAGITDDNGRITVDLLAGGGSAVDLAPGTYWYVFYTTQQTGVTSNRWNWFAGENNLENAQIITPSTAFDGAFPDWTDLTEGVDPAFTGLAFSLKGDIDGVTPPTPPGPVMAINNPTIDYGSIVNTTTSTLNLLIENTGSSNLIIESIVSDSDNFEVNFNGPGSLAPRGVAGVQVKFVPDAVGVFDATVTVTSNSSTDPVQTASLTAVSTDIPAFAANPDSVSVQLGEGSQGSFQFTINNDGAGPLEFFMPDFFVEPESENGAPRVQSIANRQVSQTGMIDLTERTVLQRYHDGTLVNPTEEELAIIEGYQSLRSDNNTASGAQLTDIAWTLNFNVSVEGWFFQRQNNDDYVGTLTGVNGDFVGVDLPQGTFTNDLTVLILDGLDLTVEGIIAQIGGTGPVADHTGEFQPWGCGDFDDPVNCGVTLNTPVEMGADKYIWIGNGYSESTEATWQGTLVFDGITGPIDFLSGVSPDNGVVEAGGSTTVTVSMNPGTAPQGVYDNVLAITTNVPNLPNFSTIYGLPVTLTIGEGGGDVNVSSNYINGWNMVSMPVEMAHSGYQEMFPNTSGSSLYSFNGSYVLEETMMMGSGYWLNFTQADEVSFSGPAMSSMTMSMLQGWNMVGALHETTGFVDNNNIIQAGTLFGFNGSYVPTTTMEPGQGYWVSTSAAGDVGIAPANASMSSAGQTVRDLNDLESFNSLTLESGEASVNLYFGNDIQGEFHRNQLSLPPVPPAGMLDARFNGGYWITDMKSVAVDLQQGVGETSLTLNGDATYSVTFLSAGKVVGTSVVSAGQSVAVPMAADGIQIGVADEISGDIPAEFSLNQNYPNPFNPSTSIQFGIPESSDVKLEVMNMLGQRVALLVDENRGAGLYTVAFDASNLSSGMYLYRLQAGNFVQTRKLTLIK
jgi:hypothetical protein